MKQIFLALVLGWPLGVHAYCMEPSFRAPFPPPRKPDKPFCAAMKSCSQWDVDGYSQDLEDYVRRLKQYVQDAQEAGNRYADDALAYAKCQLRSD